MEWRFQLALGDDARTTLGTYIRDVRTSRSFGGKVFQYLRAAEIRELASDHNIAFAVNSDTSIVQEDRNRMVSKIRSTARKVFLISVHGYIRMKDLRHFSDYRNTHEFARFQRHQYIIPSVLRESAFLTYGIDQCVPIHREDAPFTSAIDRLVYRAYIDTDYYDIATLEGRPDNPELSRSLAVMEIRISSPAQVSHARSQIEFAQFLATHASHEHITKPYATFALRSMYPGETTHYLITEFPRGNLLAYFKATVPQPADDWMRRQLRGLAAALDLIHTPTNVRFGIHHDIRPKMVAVCSAQDGFTFKLAPSSQSRIIAQDGQALPGTSAMISSYHPPESTNGLALSRSHDIWSLGCVFLETMVWYTQGTKAYTDFLEAACGKDRPRYWFAVEKGQVVLRGIVKQQLDMLEIRKKGKWANLVGVIRMMLATDASWRITASELVAAFNHPSRPI